MPSQKRENLLNLALEATDSERRAIPELNAGYNASQKTWEVIVQYQGDLSFLLEKGITITFLLFHYAILIIPESLIDYVTSLPQITYMEKPKLLFFSDSYGRSISCINPLQEGLTGLYGDGVLIACVDSGIDYAHPDFRNEDGSSRILALWDQSVPGTPPFGYHLGSLYTREQINEALSAGNPEERYALVPSRDATGHGTAVMGIAAGNGRSSDGVTRGVAPKASLLVMKLGNPNPEDLPRTTQLLQAVDFAVRYSLFYARPLSLNLSFGNNYGSHSGNSLIETYLNSVSNLGQNVICIGSGNEGNSGRHTSGTLDSASGSHSIEFGVGPYESSLNLQIWKFYGDEFSIHLISPGGIRSGALLPVLGAARLTLGSTEVLLYYGMPSPYSQAQEIYLTFQGRSGTPYVESGIWTITLEPKKILSGSYDLWLPGGTSIGPETRFFLPSADTTLTIPSTSRYGLTVGAYNPRLSSYADFSGRGYTRLLREIKPDLCAPGVNILAPRAGGGYDTFTGTSFATPFVTGSAALLMEWGILKGNDPFLYGEKIKAYLIKGARRLATEREYPNQRLGWGVLCLKDSLPT
ncbi:MAG: S8 family peptidase [Fusicatenibacter sp.]|nr:S8 family serine peptidase [Lachnospiraceae bacterium]MDY2937587.1 S8 family peptidase [Fusicatenibacter sp.]